MSQPLKVLLVEDNPADAELIQRQLRRSGFEINCQHVDTESAFLARLHPSLDLVLSDYEMPQFSGLKALELLKKSGLDVPFILISGMIGEESAVVAMREGAADYLLKDRLARLGPAVDHALEQGRLRRERKRTELALMESERRFRELLENVELIAVTLDQNGLVTFCNDYLLRLTQCSRGDVVGKDWFSKFFQGADPEVKKMFFSGVEAGAIPTLYERPIRTSQGEWRDVVWNNTLLRDGLGNVIGAASLGEDVTERKKANQKIQDQLDELLRWQEVMLNREGRVQALKQEVNELLALQHKPLRYFLPTS